MTTDVSEIMSSYGGRRPHESNESIVVTMGSRKQRLADLGPTSMTGASGAAFSQPLSGMAEGSTLSIDDPASIFTISGVNIVASAPDAGTYPVTVTETNPAMAASPHSTVITIVIS